MSFFKDFKEDLSLAVNGLLPGEDMESEDELEGAPEMMVNTLEGDLDIESELSKLDGLLERVEEKKDERKRTELLAEDPVLEPLPDFAQERVEEEPVPENEPVKAEPEPEVPQAPAVNGFDSLLNEMEMEITRDDFSFDAKAEEPEEAEKPQPKPETLPVRQDVLQNKRSMQTSTRIKEEPPMNEEMAKETTMAMDEGFSADSPEITDEVSVITAGTSIKGNLSTTGSFSINGRVEGNVQCNGKLEVTGIIKGNSSSSEVFSDEAKIEGEITSTGTVKIGLGSIVVGNISATSAVIAGAVKGDIDVQGPVVVDTSAVIVGNIKSRSVQINNGAVIEGFCSQCYADIDVESLFGDNKKGK